MEAILNRAQMKNKGEVFRQTIENAPEDICDNDEDKELEHKRALIKIIKKQKRDYAR